MDSHENARTTRHSRMLMIQRLQAGWAVTALARAFGVTPKAVRKWRDRFDVEGAAGLAERSSRPHRTPSRLAEPAEAKIEGLRRTRMTGPAIARRTGRPLSTIGVVLRRRGLGRLRVLEPRSPVLRYERERPGELIHIDIKKLGRIEGIGHRITGDRTGQSNRRAVGRGLAGNTFTSRSMTARVWRSPSCCPANARNMPPPSSTAALPGSAVTALSSNG